MSRTSHRKPNRLVPRPAPRHGQGDGRVERPRPLPRLQPELEHLGSRLRAPAARAPPGRGARSWSGHERHQRLPDQESGLHVEQVRGRKVGFADDAVEVGEQVGVGGVLEEVLVAARAPRPARGGRRSAASFCWRSSSSATRSSSTAPSSSSTAALERAGRSSSRVTRRRMSSRRRANSSAFTATSSEHHGRSRRRPSPPS